MGNGKGLATRASMLALGLFLLVPAGTASAQDGWWNRDQNHQRQEQRRREREARRDRDGDEPDLRRVTPRAACRPLDASQH